MQTIGIFIVNIDYLMLTFVLRDPKMNEYYRGPVCEAFKAQGF